MSKACVYILRCGDGSLYTGWSSDLPRRLARHRAGKASRYTASRLPVELALSLPLPDRRAAMRAEARIKALSRREKLALIASVRLDYGASAYAAGKDLMCIGRLADRWHMQRKHPSITEAGPGDGAEPIAMERDEMRSALERISQEMLQRVADSFETVSPPPRGDQ